MKLKKASVRAVTLHSRSQRATLLEGNDDKNKPLFINQ
jgi:hypothetical protein